MRLGMGMGMGTGMGMDVGALAGMLALLPIMDSAHHALCMRMHLLASEGAATHGPAAREAAATGCLVAGSVTCAAASNSQTTVSNTSKRHGGQPGSF